MAVRAQRESQIRFSGMARTVESAISDESSRTVRCCPAASAFRPSHCPLTSSADGKLGGGIVQYREEMAGTTGTFEFQNVAPGDYYVVAFDRVPYIDAVSRGLPPGDLPASIIPLATRVRVEEGSTASVDLKVNRWPW